MHWTSMQKPWKPYPCSDQEQLFGTLTNEVGIKGTYFFSISWTSSFLKMLLSCRLMAVLSGLRPR
jgi:hypothetical protein